MSSRHRIAVVVIAASYVLLAACGVVVGNEPPTPSSSPVGPPPPDPAIPERTAPALNLDPVRSNPCSLLTDADFAGIPVDPVGEFLPNSVSGPRCYYTPIEPAGPRVSVVVNDRTGGLKGLYERRSNFGVFDPGFVDGYPTVNAIPATDPSVCSLSAGVNDADLLLVDFDAGFEPSPELDDRCGVASRLLSAVIARAANAS